MSEWSDVAGWCALQHGVVSADELAGPLGVSRAQLRAWVRGRRLVRVAPRVWRVNGSPVTWEQRLRVGLLSLGRDAVVSHDAAARLHELDRAPRDAVEFTVPRGQRTARITERVHSTRVLPPTDCVRIDGFRATSATRTIIDLARARVSGPRLAAAIDSAIRSGASAPVVIQRRLAALRGPGRWGCRHIDALLVHAGGHTMLERYFLELLDEYGLPRPRTQVVFRDDKRTLARVDFLFDDYTMVVEVTGRVGHSTPAERARDAQRRNELQDLGVRVFEYTWEHLTRHTEWVGDDMTNRLLAAGWQR